MHFLASSRFRAARLLVVLLVPLFLLACAPDTATIPPGEVTFQPATTGPDYIIGPGDTLQIFVWRNPELTTTIPVRPDGRITVPPCSVALISWPPSRAVGPGGPPWLREAWGSGGLPPGLATSRRRDAARSDAACGPAAAALHCA